MCQQRHRLLEWMQEKDSYIFCLKDTHFSYSYIYKLYVREWNMTFHANREKKKAGSNTPII